MPVRLRRFIALSKFTDAELLELEAAMTRVATGGDGVILREGGTSDAPSLYAVVSGQVLITRQDATRGEELRFGLGEGSLFGVVAFVDGGPRTATVTAVDSAEIWELTQRAAGNLSPTLSAKLQIAIAVQLARDFASMNRRVVEAYGAASAPPPTPDAEWLTLHSYSGLHVLQTEMHRARSLRDIVATLMLARKQGRTVTVRGSGLSFDTQAMHSDLTLSLKAFDEVRVDPDAQTMTVGASAQWGSIVSKLEPWGLVPSIVVSGQEITVGGTIGVNAMSRFTPVWGKEGKWLESLDVLTVGGERLTCSRTQEPDLFYGIVGGLGQLAIVLSATYRVQRVGTPVRVESVIERSADPARIAPALTVGENDAADATTSYGVVAFKGDETRCIITRSRYVNDVPLRTCLPHRPSSAKRVPIELAIHHFQSMGQAFWNFAYDHYLDEKPYVDELSGYTFFMDGNLRTKRAAETVGIPFRTVQQAYVIPVAADLAPFIQRARDKVAEAGLELALVDVLYTHEDEGFCLSSSYGHGGYIVTLTFEGLESLVHLGRARELMVDLATDCLGLGGRIHLTKNVFVRPGELSRMYGPGLSRMAELKRRYDPQGLLASDFVQRLFPELRVR